MVPMQMYMEYVDVPKIKHIPRVITKEIEDVITGVGHPHD